MGGALVELARRRKGQAPPPWVIWEALWEPLRSDARGWMGLREGEVAPIVLDARRPSLVVWRSIWRDEPDLQIRLEIEPDDGGGSVLTWILLGREGQLGEQDVRARRHRLNELLNGALRESFDQ